MTSSNCYSSLYPFPIDLNEDYQHQHHQLFSLKSQPFSSSSNSSSLTCPIFFNSTVPGPAGYNQRESQQLQYQEVEAYAKKYVPQDGPLESDSGLKLSIWKKDERINESRQSHENSSAKWMSSKMRMMRKMMMSSDHTDLSNSSTQKFEDQKQQPSSSPDNSSNSSYNNNNNSTIRVCADCNTTKTPLWRSGPRGPMSLCNACGIRQRKARRAMAEAAAAAANGTIVAAETTPRMKTKVQHKGKRSRNGCVPQFKNKNCKRGSQSQSRKKLCFEDLRIILSKNTAFHGVFPQDEKEAAILLMALSYGLVHG